MSPIMVGLRVSNDLLLYTETQGLCWERYRALKSYEIHLGLEWHIFHILTSVDIDDVIMRTKMARKFRRWLSSRHCVISSKNVLGNQVASFPAVSPAISELTFVHIQMTYFRLCSACSCEMVPSLCRRTKKFSSAMEAPRLRR